jgi:DNA-binding MarR family transcriptional regulator
MICIMTGPTSYDECNLLAIRRAARYVTQLYERHLSEAGVTAAQFSILAKLARRPYQTMLELAEAMMMERTTLLRALKPLQRDGLIQAEPSEHDARTHVFSLTKAGQRTLEHAKRGWHAAQEELETKFGRARAKALRSELFALTGT